MAENVLKQIKFGSTSTPIAKSVVAIKEDSKKALSVVATNDQLTDNADPTYTIALAVDGKTITKTGDKGLATSLALKVEAAEESGENPKKARIALVDSNGGEGYAELSSVNIEDIVGDSIVTDASYDSSTGELTIVWAGSTEEDPKKTVIDLGALLDIQDIVIKSDSTDYLSFAAIDPGTETGGQAQIGVKLASVTGTASNLSVDETSGSLLDASNTIDSVKTYVDGQVQNLAVTAQGDNYITAAQDAQNNKKINVSADVQSLTATAGTPGTYGTDGSETTAPTAGTLSGTANSLADGADIATKVKTYVDGAIAIEAARSDAKNKADIAALDVTTDAAVAGQYVAAIEETDGVVAVKTRANVSEAVLNKYAKGTDDADIAATDTINKAFSKIEVRIDNNENTTAAALNNLNDKIDGVDTDLTAEETRAKAAETAIDSAVGLTKDASGEGRTYSNTGDYIGKEATNTITSDIKALDTQLKIVTDKVGKIQYKVTDTTLEFFGISEKTGA